MSQLPFRIIADDVIAAEAGRTPPRLPDLPALVELREHRQWVAWHIIEKNGRPTKPPLNPFTGYGASHSDPASWGDYDDALYHARSRGLPGVGFVLSKNDEFTGIDLDKCRDSATGDLEPWAREIVELGETYAEVSPSGTGLRFIARGKVEKATKSDPMQVEVYGVHRYLTITGQHVASTPTDILPAPKTIAALLARVATHKADVLQMEPPVGIQWSPPQVKTSSGSDFFRRVNDEGLRSLARWVPAIFPRAHHQPSTGAYRVASKDLGRKLEEDLSLAPNGIVDFGVHDMGDPREGKRTPIDIVMEHAGAPDAPAAALWLCERLGIAPERLGWESQEARAAQTAFGAAAARKLIENAGGDLIDDETGEILHEHVKPGSTNGLPDALTRVPGLVGDLVDWIEATARRPTRVLALGAALTVVGTALGRHVCGPTRSGTSLYVLCLAPTGAGKDHGLQQAKRLLTAAKMSHHIGPDEFMSMPALINFLVRTPVSLCPMDEFGGFLRRINSKKASGFETSITRTLRTAWGVNFGSMSTPEWAGRQSQVINAPALSLYGVSTAEEFYASLEGADLLNGFLNRFLCLALDSRPPEVDPLLDAETVPESIGVRLAMLYDKGNRLSSATRNQPDGKSTPEPIPWASPAAQAVYKKLVADVERMGDSKPHIAPFYGRTAEMAIRLATIVAAGRSMAPAVSTEDVEWGRTIALWSAQAMLRGAEQHMAETETQADANRIVRIIRDEGGRATYRTIMMRLKHRMKARDLNDVLQNLEASGTVELHHEKHDDGRGHPTKWYLISAI